MLDIWNYINRGRLWRVYVRSVLKYGTATKVLNALRTEWAYRQRKLNVRTPPYVLFIEPLYYCNLKCPLCPREQEPAARKGRNEAGRLPLDLIDSIFDELGPYLFQCHIFGNGEPMLDWPRTKYIIKAARRKRIFTLVSTNCTTITPKIAEDVVTSGLDYMVCAIDGTSQASYEKYRVGGNFEQAFEGMRMLCAAAKKMRSPIALEWQFLVSKYSYPEMDRARELAKELGIFLRFSPLAAPADQGSRSYWNAPDPAWSPPHEPGFDHDFACYWLWRALVINSNSQLGRCPGYSNTTQLGTINPSVTGRGLLDSVMSIYNGPGTQRARRLFRKEPLPAEIELAEPCQSCFCFTRHHGQRARPPREETFSAMTELPPITATPASAGGKRVPLDILAAREPAPAQEVAR